MGEVITIDGPAGAGKSTVSRLLAKRIGFVYLDTGAMYRAVALVAKRAGVDIRDGPCLGQLAGSLDLHYRFDENPPRLFLGHEDISVAIRDPDMDMLASAVSAVKEVRAAMTGLQRRLAEGMGVVAEGRDMGTVVFPEARCKFYLTASPEVRAKRRYQERLERGEAVSLSKVEQDMVKRDGQDTERALAPLKPAEDAFIIDATFLSAEQVVDRILERLESVK